MVRMVPFFFLKIITLIIVFTLIFTYREQVIQKYFNEISIIDAPKRFYKNAEILYCDGLYEITLDHRKLKTPKGNVMKLDNEVLALMVATEWEAQREEIQLSSMHLVKALF